MDGAVSLEGFHAVKHALRFRPDLVLRVVAPSVQVATALCDDLAPDVRDALLARLELGPVDHPTQVRGDASRPAEDRTVLARRTSPLVLLDDPRHPGNAGAAVRVAAAAGASGVVVRGALDPWHPAVVRGSAGLHFALPVLHCDPADLADPADLVDLSGPVVALDGDGEPWTDLPDDAVLVVGSERTGLGEAVRARADRVVALPMRPGVSSLNLATAVAAALYAQLLTRPGEPPGRPGR